MNAILFINGKPPTNFPDIANFHTVFCTDGAYDYLAKNNITPNFVIGDFDSIPEIEIPKNINVIKRVNQNFTDFYKCLEFIIDLGHKKVDVFGATGMENDHFLGNLSTAYHFKNKIKLYFHDDFSEFYFINKNLKINGIRNRIISLYPFPYATKVNSTGLAFPLNNLDLNIVGQIGTRNHAVNDFVEINYEEGDLLIFISKYILTKEELDYKSTIL